MFSTANRLFLALVVLAGLFLSSALPASAGTVNVQSVTLNAIGNTKGYAEYVITLAETSPSNDPITKLEIDYTTSPKGSVDSITSASVTVPLDVATQTSTSMCFALVVKESDLRAVAVHYSTVNRSTGAVESDVAQFTTTAADLATPLRFDDAAPWIGELPLVFQYLPPSETSTNAAQADSPTSPDPPTLPAIANVAVFVFLDPEGRVFDVRLASPSGKPMFDDLAIDYARKMKYKPAYVVTPLGNEPTPSRFIVLYTFRNDQPGP